jgi:predicted PurR-regulated permease PerM
MVDPNHSMSSTNLDPSNQPRPGRRWNFRLLLFLVVAFLIGWVVWRTFAALTPFIFALALAFILAPLVDRLHAAFRPRVREHRLARPLAILIVYCGFLLGVAITLLAIVPPVVEQGALLVHNAPEYFKRIEVMRVERVIQFLGQENLQALPPEITARIDGLFSDDNIQQFATTIFGAIQRATVSTLSAVTSTISWVLAFLIVPIWLFYILNDTGRVIEGSMRLIPFDLRADVEALRIICDEVLSAYVRGQLFVAIVLGVMFIAALGLIGVPYAILLGFVAGVLAIIPFVGTFLGAAPAIVVAAFGGWGMFVKTLAAFVIIQQIDNWFISPRVQGSSVALHPGMIMVVLVVGQQLFGPIGLLIAVPITAILRDVTHYLYLRVAENRPDPITVMTAVGYGDRITPLLQNGGRIEMA